MILISKSCFDFDFNILNFNNYMKLINRNTVKTENSEEKRGLKKNNMKQWLKNSNERNKNASVTPLRFACISRQNNLKVKNIPSTKDRSSLKNSDKAQIMKNLG